MPIAVTIVFFPNLTCWHESYMATTTLAYTELINRRSGKDRRSRAGISFRLLVGAGKRETIRRQDDMDKIFFVDWYSPKLFVALLAGVSLSVVDGFLTLLLMGHGAYEVNPIMAYALSVIAYSI